MTHGNQRQAQAAEECRILRIQVDQDSAEAATAPAQGRKAGCRSRLRKVHSQGQAAVGCFLLRARDDPRVVLVVSELLPVSDPDGEDDLVSARPGELPRWAAPSCAPATPLAWCWSSATSCRSATPMARTTWSPPAPASCRAAGSGTQPVEAMACSTRSLEAPPTGPDPVTTRETVAIDTPARLATS